VIGKMEKEGVYRKFGGCSWVGQILRKPVKLVSNCRNREVFMVRIYLEIPENLLSE